MQEKVEKVPSQWLETVIFRNFKDAIVKGIIYLSFDHHRVAEKASPVYVDMWIKRLQYCTALELHLIWLCNKKH